MKIIFAQGNPGPEYTHSRHNVGFLALDALADKLDVKWKEQPKFHATIAESEIAGEKVLLIKPTTFYNETGNSARKVNDFYKLDPSTDFLVVYDDLALPFGTIRVRQQGSDAGNNGIKSLNAHLGDQYTRIRIGTLNEMREQMGNDASFVLSKFSADESDQLKKNVIPHTIDLIEKFCANNLELTSHKTLE